VTANIIQFPQAVCADVAMARMAQKVALRFGWDIDLRVAISIVQESGKPLKDPTLEATARKIADEMGIALKPGAS